MARRRKRSGPAGGEGMGAASQDVPRPLRPPTASIPHRRDELTRRFGQMANQAASLIRFAMWSGSSDTELTMHQFRTLSLLRTGRRRVTDIANALGLRLTSVSGMIDRMETKGFVQRSYDPRDRRAVWCALTPRGQQEAENLWNVRQHGLQTIADRLSDEDLETAVLALEMLIGALTRSQQPPDIGRRSA